MTDTNKKKVLVAEDDKFLMRVYQLKLSQSPKYNLVTAMDGEDAIVKIKAEKPDLILLDLIMPKKSGFDVLAEIKAEPEFKNTPVIILSNLGQDTDVKKGFELGAVDYIVKSDISIEEIVAKVDKYLADSTYTKNIPAVSPQVKTKIHCGREFPESVKFCPNCGEKL